jgi:hypothetical protein
MTQLPHIAGPIVSLQDPVGLGGEAHVILQQVLRRLLKPQEVVGGNAHILDPLTQRRQMQSVATEAEEEIGAEAPRFDLLLQPAVGGGDNAEINGLRLRLPEWRDPPRSTIKAHL